MGNGQNREETSWEREKAANANRKISRAERKSLHMIVGVLEIGPGVERVVDCGCFLNIYPFQLQRLRALCTLERSLSGLEFWILQTPGG